MADVSKLVHTEKYAVNNLLVEPFFAYAIRATWVCILEDKCLLSNQENEILPDLESFTLPLFNARMTLMAGWVGEVSKE